MTEHEMQVRLSEYFNWRRNVVVPNVYWGWGLRHEADLIVLRPSGYAIEVEIKCSVSDLKAEKKKRHSHYDEKICELWYAMPEMIFKPELLDLIPESAGMLTVGQSFQAIRRAKRSGRKVTEKEAKKLMHLGCMKYWTRFKEGER